MALSFYTLITHFEKSVSEVIFTNKMQFQNPQCDMKLTEFY